MSARRIARELAVIIMPQLPKDKKRLEQIEFDTLICHSVQILTEHARHCLSEATTYISKAHEDISEYEINHPNNARKIADVRAVPMTSSELKKQVEVIETALHLISEALDIPEMSVSSGHLQSHVKCDKCGHDQKFLITRPGSADVKNYVEELLSNYIDNYERVDEIISAIKTKWRMDRMVSIDRDILRLACTEAFFMPAVPLKVVINEAVELTKRFADDRAARFINGVLGDLHEPADHFRATGELRFSERSDNDGERESEPVGR